MASNVDLKGKQSDYHWKTFRNVKRASSKTTTHQPTTVHTRMDHRTDDSPLTATAATDNFVLSGLHPVQVKKVAINDLFKAAKTPNYKLDDILADPACIASRLHSKILV
jgi:hypothetical protein